MEKIECPVCGESMRKKSLIFHIRKQAVFEVYKAFKESNIKMETIPHEVYIQTNSKSVDVFKI